MKKMPFLLILTFGLLTASGQSKITDSRDKNEYKILTIAGRIWMTENLKFYSPEGAFFFDNDSNNRSAYGVLYRWEAAKNACPDGWRLPSGKEFQDLINYYEQKVSWTKGTRDTSSFAIQLGGMQDFEGVFSEMDESAYYWTSTEYDKSNAEYFSYLVIDDKPIIDISRKEDIADIHGTEKSNKYSVRCIKD